MSSADLENLRADEIRYRSRGKFDLAVQYQRQADLVEAGIDPDTAICSVLDRGGIGEIRWGHIGHLTAFELPSGLSWALTHDRLWDLWTAICVELEFTPEQFCEIALALARRQASIATKTPRRRVTK